jgi:hypothetical protein
MVVEQGAARGARMNGAVLTRIALRIIGLLLIGLALPNCIGSIGALISLIARASGPNSLPGFSVSDFFIGYALACLGPLAQLALGLYLLAAGNGIMRICLSGLDQARCPRCGYAHVVAHDSPCPECGFRGLPVSVSEPAPAETRPGD